VEDSLKRWPFRLLVAGAVCACAIVLACALFGGALLRAGVRFGGSLLGYAVSYGSLENHAGRLTIVRPDVAGLHSEPLFTAGRIDVAYSLRDVFGSAHPVRHLRHRNRPPENYDRAPSRRFL
jgi:hypothetical protein